MSDAVIALVTAMMTTIGLAMVNKLMSRPSEHWKQASEMREELRSDLERSNKELERLREKGQVRDIEHLELKFNMVDVNIQLKNVIDDLKHCLESHKLVDEEFARVRAEFKTCIKAGGSA